jgi:diguanylate cyclase
MVKGGAIVSDQEFKRALAYANSAIDLLKRATVPPYPQFYELLYTYATGVNPTLNARINAIFREGDATADLAERLYNEFLRAQDANERISNVSERMSQRIETIHTAIDTAMTTATSFAGTLQTASDELDSAIDPETLRSMALKLLGETRHMEDANHRLRQQLLASREDIGQLQRDLDDVRREAMLDPLTKIFNRKYFDDGLHKACLAAEASDQPLCLLLLDIDSFKGFNDTWGHQTGDQVLRLVAMTLKSNIKGRDIAARYGGEEFAAILPETDLGGAVIVADNIRKAIQAKELLKRSTNEKLGRITASFGVAAFKKGDTPSALVERTDRCLYAAKHGGRNKVFSEADLKPDSIVAA